MPWIARLLLGGDEWKQLVELANKEIFGAFGRKLAGWARENPVVPVFLFILLFPVYLAVLYKVFQGLILVATVGSVKDVLHWSRLPFFRFEDVPAALSLAMGLAAILGSIRGVSRLRAQGPSPLLDEMGAKLLGKAYEFAGPAGRKRQEAWLALVEEISKAAGIAPPKLYVLPHEKGINVMAMGLSPETSVLAATFGAMAQLPEREAEAFIAFSISRIASGQAAFETIWSGRLHGLMALSLLGRRITNKEEGWIWVPWLVEILVRGLGLAGSILARWFQAFLCCGEAEEGDAAASILLGSLAVARLKAMRPDSLGDNRAVILARRGAEEAAVYSLASGLRIVYGWFRMGKISNKMAHGVSPLFIVSPDYPAFSLRHPWISQRIKELDPDFSGKPDKVFPVPDSMMRGREM